MFRFIRRHTWSNDGSLLLLVAGTYKEGEKNIENVVWGFTRKDLFTPAFILPTLDRSPVCARFCPKIFEKTSSTETGN
jgi:hypothetical protein